MPLTTLYRHTSIRQKILAIALLTALITAMLTLVFFLANDYRHQKQKLLEQSRVLSKILASNVSAAVVYQDPVTAREILAALKEKQDVKSAYILTADYRLFADYQSMSADGSAFSHPADVSPPDVWREFSGILNSGGSDHIFHADSLDLLQPIKIDQRLIGYLALQLSLAELVYSFQYTAVEALAAMLVSMLVAMLLARWLGSRISRPLRQLTTKIKRINHNNRFDSRLKVNSFDETGTLIQTFNTMLDQLEQHECAKNALIVDLSHAKREAERASQAKSEFLSRMSHELRTPLNAIIGFSQLLASDDDQPLNADQQDSISHILRAGLHLMDLISELLDVAAVESGKLTMCIDAVDCHTVIAECLDMLDHQAAEQDIRIEYQPTSDALLVDADRLRLKQCLLNLLSNAVKYNKPHGSVSVVIEQSTDLIHLTVKDTGVGISPEQLPMLFQPFTRFHVNQENIEGTGIGLLISKHMIELMGGSLQVASRLDQGSEFTITLNRTEAPN